MSDKNTKYILTGYDFDHDVREWVKPVAFADFDAAYDEMRRRWEHVQNEGSVAWTWEGCDGYGEHNHIERNDVTREATAVSEERCCNPHIMIIVPANDNCITLVAEECMGRCDVYWIAQRETFGEARVVVLSDMADRASEFESTWAKMWDDGAYVCDDMADHEVNYMMVDVDQIDVVS